MTQSPRIILTRQQDRNGAWAAVLRNAGLDCLEIPLIRCRPVALPADLRADLQAGVFDWILFTSPQAAEAFVEAGLAANLETGRPRLGSLGEGTAAVLHSLGLTVDFAAACKNGADFARAFCARYLGPGSVLLPGAQQRMGEPVLILKAAGFTVREVALYRTEAVPPAELPAAPFRPRDLVFFCSPSAVRAFVAAWSVRPACVAIGETSATPARAAGFPTAVADTPDLPAMVRAASLQTAAIIGHPESVEQDHANQESEP